MPYYFVIACGHLDSLYGYYCVLNAISIAQDCSYCSVLAMELLQRRSKPSICSKLQCISQMNRIKDNNNRIC